MKTFFSCLIIAVIIGSIFPILFVHIDPVSAQVSGKQKFEEGLQKTSKNAGYDPNPSVDPKSGLMAKIGTMINIALSFLGVIFLLLTIYGGYTWMMASGNEQTVAKAKGIIFNAIIGLLVVLAAYTITNFIIPIWQQTKG